MKSLQQDDSKLRFYVAREFQPTTIPILGGYAVLDRSTGAIAEPIDESIFAASQGLTGEDAEDPEARSRAEARAAHLNGAE